MTSTYFVQSCPTCGRQLHVRVEYLGLPIMCRHCHAEFVATDLPPINPPTSNAVMTRVDQLLNPLNSALETFGDFEPQPRPLRAR